MISFRQKENMSGFQIDDRRPYWKMDDLQSSTPQLEIATVWRMMSLV